MNTNNLKIVSKDYLVEQFYNYHKNYTEKIKNELDAGKQTAITIQGGGIELKPDGSMSLVITREGEEIGALNYLILGNENTLSGKIPVSSFEGTDDDKNDRLITRKAISDFKGTANIDKVGKIKEGSWQVGKIEIDTDSIKVGETEIKADSNVATIDNVNIENTNINDATIENVNIENTNITNANITDLIAHSFKTNKIKIKEIECYADSDDSNAEDDDKVINVVSDIKIKKDFVLVNNEGNNFNVKNLLLLKKDNEGNEYIILNKYLLQIGDTENYAKLRFIPYNSKNDGTIFDEDFINDLDN